MNPKEQKSAVAVGSSPLPLPLPTATSSWRSLEEFAHSDEFRELMAREYPAMAEQWTNPLSRRQFLTLMAASLGLAGLSGCTAPAPQEQIMPYVRPPEEMVLGRPLYFATAMPLADDALGLLVKSREGRPIKVEGNPDHPGSPKSPGSPAHASFGATDVLAQASLLTLYDPDRSQTVTHLGDPDTWEHFVGALSAAMRGQNGPVKIRLLTETITSPTLAHQLRRILARFPLARWHVHEPIGRENAREGARRAFGENVACQYHLDQADVILALDADFLSCGPGHVKHLHDFAQRRQVRRGQTGHMNRLYVVESMPTGTGAIADHRIPLRSEDIEAFARSLAARLDERFRPLAPAGINPAARWLDPLARDLLRHRGTSLVIAGDGQPPFVHALAHALNDFLGNVGKTVVHTDPVAVEPPTRELEVGPPQRPPQTGTLDDLVEDMEAGQVDVLLILGRNPVYTAPADLHFAQRMNRVPFRVHLGLYDDETAAACRWHIPQAHYLESWGDVRAHDGTVTILQPLIAPLYGGKTPAEFLALLADQPHRTAYEIVRAYWRQTESRRQMADSQFEEWWRQVLHEGLVAGTQLPSKRVTLRTNWMRAPAADSRQPTADSRLEIVFRPDPTIYDGRFANNGWLQELPKPFSKITWDNAVYLSPASAVRLGFAPEGSPEVANEKVVEVQYKGRRIQGPLWVLPGHADNSITVHLGYGRTRAGSVGNNRGFNAYLLRTSTAPWFDTGVTLRLTERRYPLACTQHHQLMEGRDLVQTGTVQHPPVPPRPPQRSLTLYNDAEHLHAENQWGMVIDLNVCTGCSACVVACQAENNIPIVGKDEVRRGREMHWLRIDRYYKGPLRNPEIYFQPVPCMHCENAPCELVCPVGATVHSNDGLNDMVYNRCVGTRYCSNNCPYKVRRFNFFQYADFTTESLRLLHNPDVTVRSRGVMEKCTYCVQRIRAAQIDAQVEDRTLRDGDVVTACQSACPAGAIIFGDRNDRHSKVAQLQLSDPPEPLHYALLAELNARPRTTYLAALKNPNPEIAALEGG